MNGPLAMIFVVFVTALGFGACWGITAQGSSTSPLQDSFGNGPSETIVQQDSISAGLAVATMPIMTMAFIIAICVVLVITFVWLWKSGHNKQAKYS
ncbi:MAG: hypothetical protein WC626_05430 [Methanoregula sp.]